MIFHQSCKLDDCPNNIYFLLLGIMSYQHVAQGYVTFTVLCIITGTIVLFGVAWCIKTIYKRYRKKACSVPKDLPLHSLSNKIRLSSVGTQTDLSAIAIDHQTQTHSELPAIPQGRPAQVQKPENTPGSYLDMSYFGEEILY